MVFEMTPSKRFAASVLVALIPLIVLSGLLAITQHSTLFAKQPLYSDELVHWAQAAAFRDAGFNTGYFTANEKMARVPQFHFYSWGPAAPIFYGLLAHVIGWEL